MRSAIVALMAIPAAPAWAEMHVPQSRAEVRMGFAPVARQAAPAVMNIHVRRTVMRFRL